MIRPNGDNYVALGFPMDGRAVEFKLPLDKFPLCRFINTINKTFLNIVSRSEYSEEIAIPNEICEEDLF